MAVQKESKLQNYEKSNDVTDITAERSLSNWKFPTKCLVNRVCGKGQKLYLIKDGKRGFW